MHSYSCFSHFPDQPLQNFETVIKKTLLKMPHLCICMQIHVFVWRNGYCAGILFFSAVTWKQGPHVDIPTVLQPVQSNTETLLIWKWAKTSQLFVSHDQTWLCGINKYSRMCVDRHYKNINLTSVTVLDSLISMTTPIKHRFSIKSLFRVVSMTANLSFGLVVWCTLS